MRTHIKWLMMAVLFALVASGCGYNALQQMEEQVFRSWSDVESNLQRRADLIPNLVETAKGYMKHERETLEGVINARNTAVSGLKAAAADPSNPEAMKQLAAAEQGLSGALGRLFALSEAYPDLKANENMMQLSEELTTTENKVAFARQAYNECVMQYNTLRESFPNNFFAGWFNFLAAELLEIEEESKREAPQVSF